MVNKAVKIKFDEDHLQGIMQFVIETRSATSFTKEIAWFWYGGPYSPEKVKYTAHPSTIGTGFLMECFGLDGRSIDFYHLTYDENFMEWFSENIRHREERIKRETRNEMGH